MDARHQACRYFNDTRSNIDVAINLVQSRTASRAKARFSEPRVEYEATPLGHSLRDILKGMCHWSSENMEKVREFRRTRRLEWVEK